MNSTEHKGFAITASALARRLRPATVLFCFATTAGIAFAQINLPASGNIGTIAGTGGNCGYSGDNGPAINARMCYPRGVAVDASGNLYIADYGNHVIRKVTASTGVISTVAGTGVGGYSGDGGPATSAQLSLPMGVAIDAGGNLYIAEQGNDVIRKVNSSGIISTFAGIQGSKGYTGDGGAATSAQLNNPFSVAVDAGGNIYIVDNGNSAVRKVNSSGIISTYEGGPNANCYNSCSAGSGVLNYPWGVAVDASGNVYMTEYWGGFIVEATASAWIMTGIAGTSPPGYSGDGGPALSAQLDYPAGVRVDAHGNVYVVDMANDRIREITASTGVINTIAGNGTVGYAGDGGLAIGSNAEVNYPYDVVVDANGNVYISDTGNNVIRAVGGSSTTPSISVTTSGTPSVYGAAVTFTATVTSGDTNAVTFYSGGTSLGTATPSSSGIATLSNSSLYPGSNSITASIAAGGGYSAATSSAITQTVNQAAPTITAWPTPGAITFGQTLASSTLTGGTASVSGTFAWTTSSTAPNAGSPSESVKFTPTNTTDYTTVSGTVNVTVYQAVPTISVSSSPNPSAYGNSVTFSAAVTSTDTNTVTFYNGSTSLGVATPVSGTSTLTINNLPAGSNSITAEIAAGGNYAAATSYSITQTVNQPTAGIINTFAGTGGNCGYTGNNGAATSAQLCYPQGVTVDASGNVYIADYGNHAIRKISASTGVISTIAGTLGSGGYSGDGGQATSAQLSLPMGVAFDSSGNYYIADFGNDVIRKVNSSGIISTFAGIQGSKGYTGDGNAATSAQLNNPMGVAVDSSGNVYIVDSANSVIRKVTASTGLISTYAGSSNATCLSACLATSAGLNYPYDVAVDGSNNVYISEYWGGVVAEVTASTGILNYIAGVGNQGYSGDGGPATSAHLDYPAGLAVDAHGNVYIVDEANLRIREITASTGVINTFAGNGTAGYSGDGGVATDGEINYSNGIAVDASGNVYIADLGNNVIRVVGGSATTPAISVTTSGTPSVYGTAVTLTATVTSGDTNAVTFYSGGTSLGTATPSSGTATLTTSSLSLGSNSITASIAAGGNYATANSSSITQMVNGNGSTPTIIVASSGSPSTYGNSVSFTATVTSGDTNAVTFYNGGTSLGTATPSSGTATLTTGSLPAGSDSILAMIAAGGNYSSATSSAITQTVNRATPTVSGWPTASAITYGQTIASSTLAGGTASVAGTFAWTALSTSPSAGTSSESVTFTPTNITNYATVTGSVNLAINQATPTITWPTPSSVLPGTVLGAAQLDATANTPGTFVYSPATGTVLTEEAQTLSVTFTPTDITDYSTGTATVVLTVSLVPSAGIINTVAGNGTQGYSGDGGMSTSAKLYWPGGAAVDTSGNIYVADELNNRVRVVCNNCASNTTAYALIQATNPLVTPGNGDIYTVVGNGTQGFSGDGGTATSAELYWPKGVAVDASGNIYIGDYGNGLIRKVTASTGIIATVAGNVAPGCRYDEGDGGPATSAYICWPGGVAVDASGNIYLTDDGSNRVRVVCMNCASNTTAYAVIQMENPGVTPVNGDIYAVAGNGYTVGNGSISGGYSGDGGPATGAELNAPSGVAVDSGGDIYIADTNNSVVRKVTSSTGIITTFAGNGTLGYSGDGGPATSAELAYPNGVAIDSTGDLYISDSNNTVVRKVTSYMGIITTFAGNGTFGYSGDGGPATSAELWFPTGVAVDTEGNLYISDTYNDVIRAVGFGGTSTPIVTWATPNSIPYGTPLSGTQLNATANLPGTLAYTPAVGTVLTAGTQTLSVTFTPTDTTDYATITATVPLDVYKMTPTITWAAPAPMAEGSTLSATQLNASTSPPGTFVYSPAAGTTMSAGLHLLTATFYPTDSVDYSEATAEVTATVSNGSTADAGTVKVMAYVNGNWVTETSTNYGAGATPESVAEGLIGTGPDVKVSADNDQIYIQSNQQGAYNYNFQVVPTAWNTSLFSQASFVPGGITGTLDGGASSSSGQNPQQVYQYSATYDGVGNVIGYTDSVMGTWTNIGYDSLNRLSSATQAPVSGSAQSFCWTYDSFGNRTNQFISNQPFANPIGASACQLAGSASLIGSDWNVYTVNGVDPGTNQIASTNAHGTTYSPTYDAAGDVTSDGVNQYLYDAEGRICAVASTPISGFTTMTGYVYDVDGTRVAKGAITIWSCDPSVNGLTTSGNETDYILGPDGEQVTEMAQDSNGNMAWQHTNVWAAGKLWATYDDDGLHFYLDDPLGTRRAQTDPFGVAEQTCTSRPYGDQLNCYSATPGIGGNVYAGSLTAPTEHHFTGKERDTESGNDYFGARYYGSSMGRFMSPDWSASPTAVPYADLGNPQSLNLYSYAGNNPLVRVDANGHCAKWLQSWFCNPIQKFIDHEFLGWGWITFRQVRDNMRESDVEHAATADEKDWVQNKATWSQVKAMYNYFHDPSDQSNVDAMAKVGIQLTPAIPAGLKGLSDFGKNVMGWGSGDADARARIGTLTREELEKNGVTKEMAEEWRDFYKGVKENEPSTGNPSAEGRAELMQRAVDLLDGKP